MTTDLVTIAGISLIVVAAFGTAIRIGSITATLRTPASTPLERAEQLICARYFSGQISASECARVLTLLRS